MALYERRHEIIFGTGHDAYRHSLFAPFSQNISVAHT